MLRQEDGAVEFRILAQMFRAEFASSHAELLAKEEEDQRRDSSIVWIHSLLIQSFSFEQFKATLEENTSILHCKTTCCCRATSPSTSTTLEAPTVRTRSFNLGLIPGGEDVKKREKGGVLDGRESNVHRSLSREGLRREPRIAVYKHNWKRHEKHSVNAIILYNTLLAMCILKVVVRKSGE